MGLLRAGVRVAQAERSGRRRAADRLRPASAERVAVLDRARETGSRRCSRTTSWSVRVEEARGEIDEEVVGRRDLPLELVAAQIDVARVDELDAEPGRQASGSGIWIGPCRFVYAMSKYVRFRRSRPSSHSVRAPISSLRTARAA